jgi:hypothetical protein
MKATASSHHAARLVFQSVCDLIAGYVRASMRAWERITVH